MGSMSCEDQETRQPRPLRSAPPPAAHLEDFCLAGVGVRMLLPGWLGMVLVLPLGPDLAGPALELAPTLTAVRRHICRRDGQT